MFMLLPMIPLKWNPSINLISPSLTPGPDVVGKYSSDLFVSRARKIIRKTKKRKRNGLTTKPWFIYLSLQSVHDPLQVRNHHHYSHCHHHRLSWSSAEQTSALSLLSLSSSIMILCRSEIKTNLAMFRFQLNTRKMSVGTATRPGIILHYNILQHITSFLHHNILHYNILL